MRFKFLWRTLVIEGDAEPVIVRRHFPAIVGSVPAVGRRHQLQQLSIAVEDRDPGFLVLPEDGNSPGLVETILIWGKVFRMFQDHYLQHCTSAISCNPTNGDQMHA